MMDESDSDAAAHASLHGSRFDIKGIIASHYTWWILLLLLALQAGYFCAAFNDPVFWRDEAATVFLSIAPLSEMAEVLAEAPKNFTHSLALAVWFKLFGASELTARLFSLLACMGASILFYVGGRRFWGHAESGLAMAVILGVSPIVLKYGLSDAAAYGFALFASAWAFERFTALGRNRTWWTWFSVGAAGFLLTNTQPVNFAVALGLGLMWMRRLWWQTNDKPLARRLVSTMALPALFLAVSLPTLIQIALAGGSDIGAGRMSLDSFTLTYVFGFAKTVMAQVVPLADYLLLFLSDDNPGGLPGGWLGMSGWYAQFATGVSIAGIAVMAGILLWRTHRWVAVDIVVVFAATIAFFTLGSLFMDRVTVPFKGYSGFALSAALMATAMLFRRSSLALFLVALFLLRAASGLIYYDAVATGKKSDARDAAALINEHVETGDVILLANTALSPAFSYYFREDYSQAHHPYPGPIRYYRMAQMYSMQTNEVFREQTLEWITAAAANNQRLWFLYGGTPPPFPPHPWYSTGELPYFRARLDEQFRIEAYWAFDDTFEPFYVELHIPVSLDEHELSPTARNDEENLELPTPVEGKEAFQESSERGMP